jgi:phosphatidylethanolamine/phosphatidyl-N-methylethanolamine N-methyltransferase
MEPSKRRPSPRPRSRQDHPLHFLRGFLEKPREVGSVIPSSRFLEKRVVGNAELADARVVVELGPGTGGTTRALLRHMHPDARLLAIEINPRFVRLLERTLDDPRLLVHEGSAADIAGALADHGLAAADAIVSGIPFSTMEKSLGRAILCSVHESLAPGGRFVAYQFRDRVESLARDVFGRARVQMEVLNVPPMRIYHWRKGESFSDGAPASLRA